VPFLFIRTCNSDFGGIDDGAEYECNEDALVMGVRSAVGIVADEIHRGERTAAVDVRIEDQGGHTVLRTVVAISVSPLMVRPGPGADRSFLSD
jgi:hypothetical protein